MSHQLKLITNGTETSPAARAGFPGLYIFRVSATNFNGATVTLQIRAASGPNWLDVPGAFLTEEGYKEARLPADVDIRVEIKDAVPTNVTAILNWAGG